MIALIRKNIRLFGFDKMIALFTGCLLFSLSNRMGAALTLEQHLLATVSDHYYLTYFLIPLILLSCFSYIEDDSEMVIVRFSSYFSYFCSKWFAAGLIALLLVLIQTASILLSSIGLSGGNVWAVPTGTVVAELFSVLQSYFATPLLACILYTIFQFAGTWFLIGVCMWIGHFAKHNWSVRILMILYVFAVLWIKTPALQALPMTGLNHLIILHHNLHSPNRFFITISTVLLLVIIILFTVRYLWHNHVTFISAPHQGLISYYLRECMTKKNIAILCTVVLGITLYKGLKNPYLETGEEWIYFLFAGHGTGNFQMLSFVEMLIMNGAVLYLLAALIERAVSHQSIFILIRMKNQKDLLLAILAAGTQFLLLYSLFWLVAGYLGTYLFGFTVAGKAGQSLFYAVLLKFLDLLLQYMVMLLLYIFTKQITTGFLVLLAGNLLCIMPFPIAAYFPFGLSSMVRIFCLNTGTGISVPLALGIITMFMVLAGFLYWIYDWIAGKVKT